VIESLIGTYAAALKEVCMKKICLALSLNLLGLAGARADVLSPAEANAICHQKALRAAHFIAESNRKFFVTYKAATVAEISTAITYNFRYDRASTQAIYTVVAYAYPDDRSCTIGSITNNIAGND
jgi:hypothetical protein